MNSSSSKSSIELESTNQSRMKGAMNHFLLKELKKKLYREKN